MKHWKIILLAVVLSLPILFVLWIALRPDRFHTAARIQWKDTALAQLRTEFADEPALKTRREKKLYDDNLWIDDTLIHFRNGEWILYRNHCQKEDSRIHDIFLARGSDGIWYYSTFHFCRGMIVLQMLGPSESLGDFKKNYCLESFDGTSAICLKETWPLLHKTKRTP